MNWTLITNHLNSKITIESKHDLQTETRQRNSILETIIYARLTDQYKFKHQVVFSALSEKLIELGYIDNKTERYISLKINHSLTQSDSDYLTIVSQVEAQIENQQMKEESG